MINELSTSHNPRILEIINNAAKVFKGLIPDDKHLITLTKTTEILVGTWEDATWAINFYEKQGFLLVSKKEKDKLLRRYWKIPNRQIETSVVLKFKNK
jgi:hypothetical protein